MMRTKDIIEGLTILQKYRENPDGFHCGAEHDVFYAYATDQRLDDADLARMIELGWTQERDDYDEEFAVKHYNEDEGWQCFT